VARRGWWLASALAAALSVGPLLAGTTDPGAAWLVPLAAWLAAATSVVLVYPLAPRSVEIGAGILGAAGALAGCLQLGGALAS